MTTLSPAPAADIAGARVTTAHVVRSEWIKLRSLRSTWLSLLAAVLIVDGLGTLFSALHAHRGGDRPFSLDPTQVSLRGVFLAQLAIGVLGVLVITGEYATGMIRSSFAAVPRRYPVLLAKALVFTSIVFVVALAATFCAFLLGQAAQASTHMQASLSTPGAWRAIFGSATYLTLIGLLAVGIGFAVRNTAGAIATLFGIVLVAPLLTNALPSPYDQDIAKYLPLNTGERVIAVTDYDHSLFSPWAGIGVTALYAAAALIIGWIVLARRDA